MVFQYLDSILHTLVVATLDKPRSSFQVVRKKTFVKMVCIKLVNPSIEFKTKTQGVLAQIEFRVNFNFQLKH